MIDAWNRFWHAPAARTTVVRVRIAVGVTTLLWALSARADLGALYGPGAAPARRVGGIAGWSLLGGAPSSGHVRTLWVVLVLAAVLVTVGVGGRGARIVMAAALASFIRRQPPALNSGDLLVLIDAVYLCLLPAGRARMWPLRFLQLQVCVAYWAGVRLKLTGTTWHDGSAVAYALQIDDLARWHLPVGLTGQPLLANVLTWGALAVEVLFPILVWPRATRRWALAAGLALHVFIDVTIMVGFFGLAMATAYLAFTGGDGAAPADDAAGAPATA